jgi:hypothetical protein
LLRRDVPTMCGRHLLDKSSRSAAQLASMDDRVEREWGATIAAGQRGSAARSWSATAGKLINVQP